MLQAFLLYYEGKVKPKFLNQLDMMVPMPMASTIRTAECSSECSSNFLDSLLRDFSSSLSTYFSTKLYFSIRDLATGPPIREPITRPKVAAAIAAAAPSFKPAASNKGPKAVEVPGPPTKAVDPAAKPK